MITQTTPQSKLADTTMTDNEHLPHRGINDNECKQILVLGKAFTLIPIFVEGISFGANSPDILRKVGEGT